MEFATRLRDALRQRELDLRLEWSSVSSNGQFTVTMPTGETYHVSCEQVKNGQIRRANGYSILPVPGLSKSYQLRKRVLRRMHSG
jgi:hypothetical protein